MSEPKILKSVTRILSLYKTTDPRVTTGFVAEATDLKNALVRVTLSELVFNKLTTPQLIEGERTVPWKAPGASFVFYSKEEEPEVAIKVRMTSSLNKKIVAQSLNAGEDPDSVRDRIMAGQPATADLVSSSDPESELGEGGSIKRAAFVRVNTDSGDPELVLDRLGLNRTQTDHLLGFMRKEAGKLKAGSVLPMNMVVDRVVDDRKGVSYEVVNG